MTRVPDSTDGSITSTAIIEGIPETRWSVFERFLALSDDESTL